MRLGAVSLVALLWASAALADGVSIPGVPSVGGRPSAAYPSGGGGGSSPSYTPFTSPACFTSGVFPTSFSIPGVGVGQGVVWFGIITGTEDVNFSAVTLGGQAPTGIINDGSGFGGIGAAMYYYNNTAGTISGSTATLAFTTSDGTNSVCVSSGVLSGLNSPTPTAIFTPSTSAGGTNQPFAMATATVNAGGFGIDVFLSQTIGASTNLPLTWVGATRDAGTEASTLVQNTPVIGSAHLTASGTPTVACSGLTCNNAGFAGFGAAWR